MRQGKKKAMQKYGEDLAVVIDKVNQILQSKSGYSKHYKIARRVRGWLQKEYVTGNTALSGDWRIDPRLCVDYIAARVPDNDFSFVSLRRINPDKPFSPENIVVITAQSAAA